MTPELRKHLDNVKKIVDSWPEWKKNILEQSAKPTVSEPRKPINNSKCPKCGYPHD